MELTTTTPNSLSHDLTTQDQNPNRPKFSSFNIRWFTISLLPLPWPSSYLSANRKIHQELVSQRELDLAYIKSLQQILIAHGIEIPPPPQHRQAISDEAALQSEFAVPYMQDGSFESLDKAISKLAKLISLIEVDVQFRDLSFWGQPSLLAALPLTHSHFH
jgi:hypothetical protein